MFLKPALGEVKVRDFELPLDLYVILRDELLRPPAETPRMRGTTHRGNTRCHTRNKYTGWGSRSPGLRACLLRVRVKPFWRSGVRGEPISIALFGRNALKTGEGAL